MGNIAALSETEVDKLVLEYLKKAKNQSPKSYRDLIIWGVRPESLIRYIENPESARNWGDDYLDKADVAIEKIITKDIVPWPAIPVQTEEDRLIAKIIQKFHFNIFDINFCSYDVEKEHLVKYLKRDETIKEWNADFVIKVQYYVAKAKDYLLNEEPVVSITHGYR